MGGRDRGQLRLSVVDEDEERESREQMDHAEEIISQPENTGTFQSHGRGLVLVKPTVNQ
ncbi:hypothetical protein STEG23_018628, partial [Scotinomys teguina]